uniref:Putative ovule protein n=1 Tax=Solanum chacoense TaxID=4108 RepID=A0A0V0HAK8_SOLCH
MPLCSLLVKLLLPDIETFKFLKFWTDHESFKEVVRQNRIGSSQNPFLEFKEKIKNFKLLYQNGARMHMVIYSINLLLERT